MKTPHEIRFYRMLGPRSCRIEAKPIEGSLKWKILVVGDYIPTVSDKIVFEHEIYTEAEKILSEWALIAAEHRRKQGLAD